jgi:GWxTD domain-containing protein
MFDRHWIDMVFIRRSLAFAIVFGVHAAFTVFTPSLACAQPGSQPDIRYGHQLYVEAAQLPSDSVGFARVDVFLRVAYDFMIFTKSASSFADSAYGAGIDVSMHARRDGNTQQTHNLSARVFDGKYESTVIRDRFVLFRQTFYVEPGDYEFLVSVSDKGSSRERMSTQKLKVVDLSRPNTIGTPVPLESVDGMEGVNYGILGFDATLPFASPGLIGIPVSRDWNADWTVELLRLDEDGEVEETALTTENLQPQARIRNIAPVGSSGEVNGYDLHPGRPTDGDLIVLELPIEKLDVGPYALKVRVAGASLTDSVSTRTAIYWRNMPYSLRDINFAIDAMRYILTKEEYDRMRSGNEREMMRAFRRYWRDQDRTPETEYNELMTEYFMRVDETIDRYQTLFERNGAMTDRGKVYILFGPPEETQRILNQDDPAQEIWNYPSLNKSFHFIDRNHNCDYKLYEE